MIALIQRVSTAEVTVDGISVGKIGRGILAFIAVERGDDLPQAERLAERILGYRIFPDAAERMNLSLTEIDGELLLVSQFTLAADTRKGSRPSFTPAAAPEEGRRLFDGLVEHVKQRHQRVATGRFGADMQVSLINDGPVTFSLRIPPSPPIADD
jgi:D-tyrosyl-tRNA(Tyr) deacylase